MVLVGAEGVVESGGIVNKVSDYVTRRFSSVRLKVNMLCYL